MIELVFNGGVGTLLQDMGIGLGRLQLVQTPTGPVVLAVSGAEGGVVCIGFNASGAPQIIDQRYFETSVEDMIDGQLNVLEIDGETIVAVGSNGDDELVGYELGSGGLDALTSVGGTSVTSHDAPIMVQTADGFIYSARPDGSLRCFTDAANGDLLAGNMVWDDESSFHGQPTALATAVVNGQSFVLCTGSEEPSVTVYLADGTTGALSETMSMGTEAGLGLFDVPAGLEVVSFGGSTFVIIASRSETGSGAALSVLELTADGQLEERDHILDNLHTRFGQVTGITTVEHNGWHYVVVAGGDQGLDVFTLLPQGRLVHLDSIETQPGASLDSLNDVAATVVDDQLNVFVTSFLRTEVTSLTASLDAQGNVLEAGTGNTTLTGGGLNDMLVGRAGNDRLIAGGGDDILYDGLGRDTLFGGDGADLFVMSFDGARDRVSDFDSSEDRLDLSLTPMLYSWGQITVTSYSWGARLSYRGEEVDLHRAGGGSFTAADLEGAIDWSVDRPPLILMQRINGTELNDTLSGTSGNDLIFTGLGQDVIHAASGDDNIDAGDQNDTVHAGEGNDTVRGGLGRDLVFLEEGDDAFLDEGSTGPNQSDTVHGGAGNDTLESLTGGDELHGGAGNDLLIGGSGDDWIYGGTEFDEVFAGAGADHVWGGNGRDLIFLGQGDDVFSDNAQTGELGRDTVYAGYGDDTIEGGGGDDVFYGEWGADLILARLGNDTVFAGDQNDTVYAGEGADRVWGGYGRDLIFLNQGHDVFYDSSQGGELGSDTVYAGYGDDTIEGGGGNDVFFGEWGSDLVFAGAGDDCVYGGSEYDTLSGGEGQDSIWGGNGCDLMFLGQGDDIFYDNAQGGEHGRDTVFAGHGNDTIEGGNGADEFHGEWGNDLIFARLGNDMVYGGDNDDTIFGGDGNDQVWGGNGRDLVFLGQGDDVYYDNSQGGEHGRDTVFAGYGNDTIEGGNGADEFHGEDGNDLIHARLGDDTVYGGDNYDTIFAGDGDDVVFGGNGRDEIFMGNGNDRYVDTHQAGEHGHDTITGGAGADTFVFGPTMSHDTVRDFQQGVDMLHLDQNLVGGRNPAEVLADLASITSEGLLITFDAGNSLLLEGLTSPTGLWSDILIYD